MVDSTIPFSLKILISIFVFSLAVIAVKLTDVSLFLRVALSAQHFLACFCLFCFMLERLKKKKKSSTWGKGKIICRQIKQLGVFVQDLIASGHTSVLDF